MTGTERVSSPVPEALAGERVDRAVATLTGRSRASVAALVRAGGVRVDGATVTSPSLRLAAGTTLEIDLPPEPDTAATADAAVDEFTVVHEDDDVLVVDKPAGLVVHPGAGARGPTLVGGLLARYPALAGVGDPTRPGIVHRLDAGTSGLLVVARTPEAYESLVGQLAARAVHRQYRALVWGHPEADRAVIDAPIGRSARNRTRMAVVEGGKPARTRFEVEQRFTEPAEVALLRCELETGRTHQIRVHLASIGHPVVGDGTYGGCRSGLDLDRPFLHAEELSFRHPRTGAEIRCRSPLPGDLAAALARLG